MTTETRRGRLLHEQRERIAVLTFAAPSLPRQAGWCWTQDMAEEAVARCRDLETPATWAVALLAEAGLPAAPAEPRPVADRGPAACEMLVSAVDALQRPAVVGLAGETAGVGLALALACDLRIVAADARLGWPELRRGALPAGGALVRLARLAGPRILDALLATDGIEAGEALRLGLVTEVVPREALRPRTLQVAEELASKGPQALRAIKESFRRGRELPLALGTGVEVDLSLILQTTRDRMEGVRSFLERRAPQYLGQ
ncbi:MAG: enoyl-CoA hydratase/isomerase family protein [Chloroflexi bacterium]|nr:enoyl-CoA hydratase/isomerase family protein [Chloroflexota bacterium]